ncbi:hypothetical protein Q4R74_19240, partial [Morganella morganii]
RIFLAQNCIQNYNSDFLKKQKKKKKKKKKKKISASTVFLVLKMISAVSGESVVIQIYRWRHSIVSRITVINYGSGGLAIVQLKYPILFHFTFRQRSVNGVMAALLSAEIVIILQSEQRQPEVQNI